MKYSIAEEIVEVVKIASLEHKINSLKESLNCSKSFKLKINSIKDISTYSTEFSLTQEEVNSLIKFYEDEVKHLKNIIHNIDCGS